MRNDSKGKGTRELKTTQKTSLHDRELKRLEWSVKDKASKGV